MNVYRHVDDVARRMTAIEPSAPLRAGVLERLDERPSPNRRAPVATAAAAAIVVGAVAIWSVRTRPQDASAPVALARSPTSPQADAVPEGSVIGRPVHRSEAAASVVDSSDFRAWQERAVRPLAPPAPLRLEAIQPAAVTIPLLDVAPLPHEAIAIAPIAIAPIGADEETGDS
jgi:hypothetical protein